jgi:diguanylate cyclase (GGDEF)-like protein
LDNFKKINQNYGYLVGDKLIKKVGEILRKNLRNTDNIGRIRKRGMAARFGGEEFLIIFPFAKENDFEKK